MGLGFLKSYIDKRAYPQSLFVHIPKCAGTSIKNNFHLVQVHHYHSTITDIINNKGSVEKILKLNPFTIVRNPYDRLVSWFFYHKKKSKYSDQYKIYNNITFEEWVLKRCPHHWHPSFGQYWEGVQHTVYNIDARPEAIWRQLNWIEYKGNVVLPQSNIIKFEKIDKVIPQLNNIPKAKTSDREKNYKKYFTNSKVVDIVTELCADDLKYFGYKFNA